MTFSIQYLPQVLQLFKDNSISIQSSLFQLPSPSFPWPWYRTYKNWIERVNTGLCIEAAFIPRDWQWSGRKQLGPTGQILFSLTPKHRSLVSTELQPVFFGMSKVSGNRGQPSSCPPSSQQDVYLLQSDSFGSTVLVPLTINSVNSVKTVNKGHFKLNCNYLTYSLQFYLWREKRKFVVSFLFGFWFWGFFWRQIL